MSWRGSTGHIDANVPDYQKMLQNNYPSSGWSSTQSAYPSYSGRFPGATSHGGGGGGGYMTQQESPFSRGSPSYTRAYQPSKYGLASDTSYTPKQDSHHSDGNTAIRDESARRSNANYDNLTYGYVARDFDFGPYRSTKHRDTDYSSDSGRGRVASHTTDYSSDSGLNLKGHRRRSSEFELEIPSPDTSRQKSHTDASRSHADELMVSPVKSHVPLSDYLQYKNSHDSLGQNDRHEILPEYQHNHHDHVHSRDKHHGKKSSQNTRLNSSTNPNHRYGDSTHQFNHNNHNESSPRNGDISDPEKEANHRLSPSIDDVDFGHGGHSAGDSQHGKMDNDEFHANFLSPPRYTGEFGNLSGFTNSSKPPRGPSGDLTRWQQSQRGGSKADLISPHHNHHPKDSYSSVTHDSYHLNDSEFTHHHDNHDPPSPRQHNTDQMDNLRSAADAIIRDKDAIIDELRSQVISLQESAKENENKLRRTVMSRGNHSEEAVSFSKIQDLEYRNAELRTELAKLRLTKDTEVEDLEIKLGGVEHEVVQLKAALRKAQPNTAEMKEKLQLKDEEVAEWKKKHGQLKDRYQGLHDKLEGMERYLADLPTQEEFSKQAQQLLACRDDDDLKTAQVTDLEERLTETTQMLSERDTTIQELEGKQQQLATKMRELTTEMKRIKSGGEGKALQETQEELTETREVKERLALDLEKAKKLLEMNHRRLRQIEVKHQTEVRQVRERLTQEEESVIALREEARLHEQQISKLKKSLKEFASKNQDLVYEGLILKEQIKNLETASADDNQKLQRRFVKEMGVCFTELQSLVQICMQRADGKEPDISLLLGMKGSAPDDEEGAVGGSKEEHTLKHWFTKLKELRAELETVRKMICNKYAEEMGDNLNCATQ